MFGHEIVSSGDQHIREVDVRDLSPEERIEQKQAADSKLADLVRRNLEKAHEHSRRNYNLRYNKPSPVYQVGQQVYRRNLLSRLQQNPIMLN